MGGILKRLLLHDVLLVLCVLLLAKLVTLVVQWLVRQLAEKVPSRFRLAILRTVPLIRLLIGIGAIVIIVPILIEPTFQNIVTLLASVSLTLAFALKDCYALPISI